MVGLDGVIKFRQEHIKDKPFDLSTLLELNSWRGYLYYHNLIGCDPERYDGAGFGNASQRLSNMDKKFRDIYQENSFIITGSQTGHLEKLTPMHYVAVIECKPKQNLVVSKGPIVASSESMTHGMLYELSNDINFVFHAHSPKIWKASKQLEIPTTDEKVEYGTPEMVDEVNRLFRDTDVYKKKIFSMGGHEDGIVTFGKTSSEAGVKMIDYLNLTK